MSDFWRDKYVVVIGGCGFVGSHLVDALVLSGASVSVIDDMSRGRYVNPSVPVTRIDAGDPNALSMHLRGADVVFNLAAKVAGVIYNQSHQASMFWENMRLQAAPALAMAKHGQYGRLVQVSSVCVYSERNQAFAVEEKGRDEEPVGANNGYAWSKRMGERVPEWAGIDHVIVRPTNIYGPHDYFDDKAHVIPALIRKTFEDDVVVLWGNGNQLREFIYVTDVARGMMLAAENGLSGSVYNLSTNSVEAITMIELASKIQELSGVDKPIALTPENDGGDRYRRVSGENARIKLGFEYSVDLDDGLAKTIDWWRKNGAPV